MNRKVMAKEKAFLNSKVKTYRLQGSDQNKNMRDLAFRTFEPFIKQDKVGLALGYADGYEAEVLSKKVKHLDVLEGSKSFFDKAVKEKISNVNCIYSLFEDFKPAGERKYDYVFANYVLEHVVDTGMVLDVVKSVLKDEGLFFLVVPNARAFSRQLALSMGIIDDLYRLTDNDIAHGHRRVYDQEKLDKELSAHQFEIISKGGLMFKILADFQMDELFKNGFLNKKHINGLYKLGIHYPDFAGSLFAVCRKK